MARHDGDGQSGTDAGPARAPELRRSSLEEQLRYVEKVMVEAQQLARVGSWDWNVQTNEVEWSDALFEMYGLSRVQGIPPIDEYMDNILPEDREALAGAIQRALEGSGPYAAEYRVIRYDDGTVRHLRAQGEVTFDGAGRPLRLLGAVQDVTEQRRAERALREALGELEAAALARDRSQAAYRAVVEESRAQLRALVAHHDAAREADRKQLAMELHDELGQSLAVIGLDLEEIESDGDDAERRRALIGRAKGRVQDAITRVQQLAMQLRPPMLDALGIVPTLEWHLEQLQGRAKLELHLDLAKAERFAALEPSAALAVFRVFQEALTNVLRHARAERVWITLREELGLVTLEVRDDGQGVSDGVLDSPGSLGLIGMRERMAALGGSLYVGPGPAGGTVVRAVVPSAESCAP